MVTEEEIVNWQGSTTEEEDSDAMVPTTTEPVLN